MNSLLDSNNTQVVEIEEIYVVSPSDMFCIKYMARIGFFFQRQVILHFGIYYHMSWKYRKFREIISYLYLSIPKEMFIYFEHKFKFH